MSKLSDQQLQVLVETLREGKDLPEDYKNLLFPLQKQEYELVYSGKTRVQDILSETWAVPLQAIKTFSASGKDETWTNRLIFGDNLQVLKRLLDDEQVKKKVKLIYIDPPFATRLEFRGSQDQKAYQDKIAGAKFLEFLRQRLVMMHALLADEGLIYVHLDYRKVHYAKVLLDEIFGEENFMNDISWCYSERELATRHWNRKHDSILVYAKNLRSDSHTFNWLEAAGKYSEGTIDKYEHLEGNRNFQLRGRNVKGSPWKGKHGIPLHVEKTNPDWVYRDYLDDKQGIRPRDWWSDIPFLNRAASDRFDYPSSKNPLLLERIIKVCSNPGDIVLDAFAGSGTTCAVAEKLGRRWIAIDCGKLAIYTIQKRLLSLKETKGKKGLPRKVQPFTLYNAGLYDFSRVRALSWTDYRLFAMQLFQIRDEPHKLSGITIDGFKNGNDALIFNFQERTGVQLDSEYIDELHKHIGQKARKEFFIIAPAACVTFLEDYIDRGSTRYYILRIPYSIIDELHSRPFKEIRQPIDSGRINDIVEAVGFDFIRPPVLKAKYKVNRAKGGLFEQAVVAIQEFESDAMTRGVVQGGRQSLSMVMVDYDYKSGGEDVFELDSVFFRDEIEAADWEVRLNIEAFGERVMLIYLDIFGNELRELKTLKDFGHKGLSRRPPSRPNK